MRMRPIVGLSAMILVGCRTYSQVRVEDPAPRQASISGGTHQLDVEGTYAVRYSNLSASCRYEPRLRDSEVEVFFVPNSTKLRIIVDGTVFDSSPKGGGRFDSHSVLVEKLPSDRRVLSTTFWENAMSARLSIAQVTSRGTCQYVIGIQGTRR